MVRDHAIHLAGAQLAVVVLMTASLAIAAAPPPRSIGASARAAATPTARLAAVQPASAAAGPEAPVIRLQDMSADQARAWNASIPISTSPNPAAKPFRLSTEGVLDEARAIDCMTAAIYYEAAQESPDGQRAVAQVVLNRMRHPAFPQTVCGVVFQGAQRTTGCQFTFTCDGSLARKPSEQGWARAREVAVAALNGYVMKKVGNATHYHAAYVAPYWSPSLVKVAVVGAHIFYRWTGGWGQPPAFAGRYAGGGETAVLKVAALDGVSRAQARLTLAATGPEPPQSTQVTAVEAPAPKAEATAPPADLVPAAQTAQNASAIAMADELDWQGRLKPKGPPRLAMPPAGRAF